jgi:hypothetical protein
MDLISFQTDLKRASHYEKRREVRNLKDFTPLSSTPFFTKAYPQSVSHIPSRISISINRGIYWNSDNIFRDRQFECLFPYVGKRRPSYAMNKGCSLQPEEQVLSYSDGNDTLFLSSNSIVRHLQQRTSSPLRTEHTFQHKRNVYRFKSCPVSNQKSIQPLQRPAQNIRNRKCAQEPPQS